VTLTTKIRELPLGYVWFLDFKMDFVRERKLGGITSSKLFVSLKEGHLVLYFPPKKLKTPRDR